MVHLPPKFGTYHFRLTVQGLEIFTVMHPCNPICRSCHCPLCPVVLPMTSWIGHWLGIYSAVVGWVWTAHLRVREAQSHHQIPGGFAYGWNRWSNGESFPSSSKISKISCGCLEQGCLFWREEAIRGWEVTFRRVLYIYIYIFVADFSCEMKSSTFWSKAWNLGSWNPAGHERFAPKFQSQGCTAVSNLVCLWLNWGNL